MRLFFLFIFFCLSGCGNLSSEKLRQSFQAGNYPQSQNIVKELYQEDENQLLRLLTTGQIHFLNKEYYQALQNFKEANDLSDKLYTQSLSKLSLSQVAGDGLKEYRGETYELSFMKLFEALTHYHLAHQGFYESFTEGEKIIPQKQLSETARKHHLQNARSVLKSWALLQESFSDSSFRHDLSSAGIGGALHEEAGTSHDKQTAKILYKNALKTIKEYGKNYPSFANHKKQESFFKEKSTFSKQKKSRVEIILFSGMVMPKHAEKVFIPLHLADLDTAFINSMLGNPYGQIAFELPAMKEPNLAPDYTIRLSGDKNMMEKEAVLLLPVSEIAYKEFERQKTQLYLKKSARLITKYTAALVASHALVEEDGDDLQAKLAFLSSAMLINASEYADLRGWITLPEAVYQQSFYLKKGKYKLEIFSKGSKIYSNMFEIDRDFQIIDINLPSKQEKNHE